MHMMHGISNPNIDQKNTLSKLYGESNIYDVVLANPSFKGSIDESSIGDNFRIQSKKNRISSYKICINR